uniref:Uncharacterized protein n=1 Tax=Rhizophora mucronata TaxID=61149 RepID=A0A2P2N6T8_RHIMU
MSDMSNVTKITCTIHHVTICQFSFHIQNPHGSYLLLGKNIIM